MVHLLITHTSGLQSLLDQLIQNLVVLCLISMVIGMIAILMFVWACIIAVCIAAAMEVYSIIKHKKLNGRKLF